MQEKRCRNGSKMNRISEIRMVDYSPEKAGVGGSTPSLATINIGY